MAERIKVKTALDWTEELTGMPWLGCSFLINPSDVSAIQTDARTDLLERIKSLETERSDFLQWFDRHHVEHTVAKDNMTLKQMADHVYERTAEKVDRLELELERSKADRNAEGVRQRGEYLPKLEHFKNCTVELGQQLAQRIKERDQAHKALKLAGEALELVQYTTIFNGLNEITEITEWLESRDKVVNTALAAIKACGVE